MGFICLIDSFTMMSEKGSKGLNTLVQVSGILRLIILLFLVSTPGSEYDNLLKDNDGGTTSVLLEVPRSGGSIKTDGVVLGIVEAETSWVSGDTLICSA